MSADGFSDLVPPPRSGRVFRQAARPGFADCAPSGRTRLDALARWLQDVAYADVEDAGLAQAAVWVVRRSRIKVRRWPRFGEQFELATFCSGMGRMWAERRTTISRAGGPEGEVEAVSLWVHLDPESWRPVPLGERELAIYGPSGADRKVTARLRHPPPPGRRGELPPSQEAHGSSQEAHGSWRFRATELDIAGHINNAAYWQLLEEELLGGQLLGVAEPEQLDAEVEFRTPCQPGEQQVLRDAGRRWIIGDGGELHASALIHAA